MLKPFQRFYFFHTLCPFCHQILSAILLNHSECDHFAAPPPTTLARMTKIDSLDCWRSLLLHLSAVMLAPLQTVFNTAIKVIFLKKCSLLKNVPMASYLSQVKAKVLTMAWRSYIIYLIFYPLMDLTYYLLPCSLHSSHNDFHALPGTQDTSVSGPFT